MRISLNDFIRTGEFDCVKVGQTRRWLEQNFPRADSETRMSLGCYIWLYSCFEFHFFDGELLTLWCDNLEYLDNPENEQFIFDLGIFEEKKISLRQFIEYIDKE